LSASQQIPSNAPAQTSAGSYPSVTQEVTGHRTETFGFASVICSEISIKKEATISHGYRRIVGRTRNMLCVRTLALMDSVLFATYVEAGGTRHACPRCARSQSLIQFGKCMIIRSVIHTACGPTADTKGTYVPFLYLADS